MARRWKQWRRRASGADARGRLLSFEQYEPRLALSTATATLTAEIPAADQRTALEIYATPMLTLTAGSESRVELQEILNSIRQGNTVGEWRIEPGFGAKLAGENASFVVPLLSGSGQNVHASVNLLEGGYVALDGAPRTSDWQLLNSGAALDSLGASVFIGADGDGEFLDATIFDYENYFNGTSGGPSSGGGSEIRPIAPPLAGPSTPEGGLVDLAPGMRPGELAPGTSERALAATPRDAAPDESAVRASSATPAQATPIESLRARAVIFEVAGVGRRDVADDFQGDATATDAALAQMGDQLASFDATRDAAAIEPAGAATREAAKRDDATLLPTAGAIWRALALGGVSVLAPAPETDGAVPDAAEAEPSARDAALDELGDGAELSDAPRDGAAAIGDWRGRSLVGAAVAAAVGAGVARSWRRFGAQRFDQRPPRRDGIGKIGV